MEVFQSMSEIFYWTAIIKCVYCKEFFCGQHVPYLEGDHWAWKVMEFRKTIFQAWIVMETAKVMENPGKPWKSHT